MTPEKKADIAERYGWQEGERDALQRDISERKRRDAHDEAVAWAKRQVAAKAEAERQSQAEPLPIERSTETKPMTTQPTDDWVRYIKRQVSKSERLMADCVARYLRESRKTTRRRSMRCARNWRRSRARFLSYAVN